MNIAVILLGSFSCVMLSVSPALALLAGFCVSSICALGETRARLGRYSKLLLGWAIVGLGATVKLSSILALSSQYFLPTISGILITLALSWLLGKRFGLDPILAALIGSGTAICGASAVAAVGSAVKAKSEHLSMALGVVLVLNAVGLLVFPPLGHFLGLSPHDFAVWAGLAVHDTSSVVGAALSYDSSSVSVATTVKLARALWIAPLTALFTYFLGDHASGLKLKLPWFIWGYLLAAALGSFVAIPEDAQLAIGDLAKKVFSLGLFLIGCSIEIKSLTSLGIKPLLTGIILWLVSAAWSLALIIH